MDFMTCRFTDAGGRSPNEDSVGFFERRNYSAWIAADGLGGHESGEVASSKAVDTLRISLNGCNVMDGKFVERTFHRMNEEVLLLGGPLTTAVCAFSDGHKLWYGNNGDSRLLFIRNKKIQCHTNDHSIAYVAYLTGNISYEDIPMHPAQNRLFHSLGSEEEFDGEFYTPIDLKSGDAFLLATDGFWELVTNEEIVSTRNASLNPKGWMTAMLAILQKRLKKTSDNYSAVCVFVK